MPADVLGELLLNVGLFPFWSADLRRPWWSFLPASDASPSFGFGFNIAQCSSTISRAVAAGAERHDCVVRLTLEDIDPPEVERVGPTLRLPLTMTDFKPIFSIKAATTTHSGGMELEGVKLVMRWGRRACRSKSRRATSFLEHLSFRTSATKQPEAARPDGGRADEERAHIAAC